MSGHYICDRCGYDGDHADWCVRLRPASEQWRGNRSKKEMEELKESTKRKISNSSGDRKAET